MSRGRRCAARLAREEIPLDQAMRLWHPDRRSAGARASPGHHSWRSEAGNVMLTKTGAKLLDFGLARQLPAAAAAGVRSVAPARFTLSAAPVLGHAAVPGSRTVGREAARRAHRHLLRLAPSCTRLITRQRAFPGDSYAAVVAAIMRFAAAADGGDYDLCRRALERAVATCLAKDPDERWQNAGDLARELKWIGSWWRARLRSRHTVAATSAEQPRLWMAVAAVLALSTLTLAITMLLRSERQPQPSYRTSMLLPEGLLFPGRRATRRRRPVCALAQRPPRCLRRLRPGGKCPAVGPVARLPHRDVAARYRWRRIAVLVT